MTVSASTASASFTLGRAAGAVAVPAGAILEDQGERFVYVAEGGVARRVVVRPGIREGGWVEVGGLPAGASVIVSGNTFVSDGAAVIVRDQEPS